MGLTKAERKRLQDLQEARMLLCDAGKWKRDSYNISKEQYECEEEIRKLRNKEKSKNNS